MAAELDALFVSLSVKGLAESLSMIRAYKDAVKAARDELTSLVADASRSSRATSFVPPRPTLPVARRLPTAPRLPLPVAVPASSIPTVRPLPVARPIPPPAPVPVGKPIKPPEVKPWLQLAAAVGLNKHQVNGLTAAVAKLGAVARISLAGATASVLGFVRAGLSGTVEGGYLALQWQMLSREIASVFLPLIRKITDLVQQLVTKFQQLDGDGQARVRNAGLFAGALGVAAGVVPKLVGGMAGMAQSAAQLALSFGASLASAGLIGIAVAAVLAVLAAWAALFAVAYVKSAELRASVSKLIDALGGVWDQVSPAFTAVFEAMGRGLAFVIEKVMVPLVKWGAAQFVFSWNSAIQLVQVGLLGLATVLGTVATAMQALLETVKNNMLLIAAVMPALAAVALAADKAGADAAVARAKEAVQVAQQMAKDLNKLKIDPNKGPKKPGEPGERVRQAGGGAESSEATFRRLQDALYKVNSGEDDPAKQALVIQREQLIALQLLVAAAQAKAAPAVQAN